MDSVDVRRLMARLLNRFTSDSLVKLEDDSRQESRSNVSMPVIVVVINEDPNSDPNIKAGVTQEISCEGMAILSVHSIPHGDVIVGIGPFDDWHVLKCTCLWTTSVGYGYFKSGMHTDKVLSPLDFEPIKQYAMTLEKNAMEEPVAVG